MSQDHKRAQRSLSQLRKLPKMGCVLIAIAFFVSRGGPLAAQDNLGYLVQAGMLGLGAMAFDFSAGYINVANFGFAAFMGVGAYAASIVSLHTTLSPWLGVLPAIAVGAAVGFATGVLTLRLRGIYAGVMAWFVGLAVMGLATAWTGVTNGPAGIVLNSTLFASTSNRPYWYTMLLMLVGTYILLLVIVKSRAGLSFRAIGDNLQAARASGIAPTRYRLMNFTVSCAIAGMIGWFYAYYIGIVTPDMMSVSQTVEILIIAYVGGRGSLWGGAVAAFPVYFLSQWLRTQFASLPGLDLALYGALLIVVMTYYPGGLARAYESGKTLLGRAVRQRPAATERPQESGASGG